MTVPMESPGYVTFTMNGRSHRLEPVYEDDKREDLFFIFKDQTSGKETYGAGRFLHTPLPKNGSVDLDFNKAYNPPCAFTAFATCPLPTRQNQLPLAIRAERHADADLRRPARDGIREQRIQPDRGQRERHAAEQRREPGEQPFALE